MNHKVQISGSFSEAASFAIQQNHVPVVRQVTVKNLSDAAIHHLQVSLATDPDIADTWTTEIDSILPEQEHRIDGINLRLSASRLFELTERINGSLTITVSDGSGILAQEKRELSFLSYDEWSGANTFPEFLSAFITPNHPYITEIIKKAGALLESWTGSPSFTGYQSNNPNHVKKQIAAVYGALRQEGIAYCMPPTSFEENGQKIRLSGTIKEQKLGTCLDLALLYAGCMEAVGLHPMIILMKGHAFVGCWLEEESFAECVQDDVSALTKRIAHGINEICVVEATAFTAGNSMSFDDAVSAAEAHLHVPEDFLYLVDVKRSRGSGIRPIPQKRADGTFSFDTGEASGAKAAVTDLPEELEILGKLEHVDSIEFTRQQLWERKLLDLSLRNTLLNFRVTKNAIQLLVNSLYDLEDAIVGGEEFQIMHRPHDMDHSPRDNKIYESVNKESIWSTLIRSEFQNRRIRTYLDERSLSGAISNLYRSAKTSMEENGANTLYLALGFLKWYESDVSEKPRYAPLVLIPVDIIRKSAQRGYVFRIRDDEPQFNVTLLEMLRMNFGMTVTGLDPLPTDEHGIDIKQVFHIIRQLIMDKPRWDVEELAFMGIFSFTQFIMWNDMRNRVHDLKRNKVVKSLMSGKMEWESDISFPSPEKLDDTVAPIDLAVPISADSSQLAAVYAAGKGQSFVLHGPPGTGKSQTITNIIANALYQGKSVLFVADKMAALSVVEKRLNTIGVGDFCLELHSNKARKKDVLAQLEKALNLGRIKSPEAYREKATAISGLRRELNVVVRELHLRRKFGFSLYEAISRVEQYAGYPECIKFSVAQISSLTSGQYTHWVDLCEMLSAAVNACGGVHAHALREYQNPRYSQNDKADTEAALHAYRDGLSETRALSERIGSLFHLGAIKTYGQHNAAAKLCALLSNAVQVPLTLFAYKDLYLCEAKIASVCAAGRRMDAIHEELCSAFSERLLTLDAETALLQWNQAETSWFLPKTLNQAKIAKTIKLYALNKKAFSKSNTPKLLELVAEYHKHDAYIKEATPLLTSLFGMIFDNGTCDWTLIESMTKLAIEARRLVQAAAENDTCRNAAVEFLGEALDQNPEQFKVANHADWAQLSRLMAKLTELEAALSQQFNSPFEQWHNEPDWISAMLERISRWASALGGLRDYCGYLQVKADLDKAGLQNVYHALESGHVSEPDMMGAFMKGISKACAIYLIDTTPALSSFHGSLFEQKIEKFKSLCQQYELLTRQELAARLSAQIPVLSTGVSGSSEIGILQRAIKSGGRMMPVRKLFESIPNLLRKLCPCMLMSPISVAQYLDPKYPAFDLVVFDEASQLPTSEAVGAIARGNELIVVGDPKQLPPTSFFSSSQIDEENYDKEDLESILDDCLALSMPQEHLLWHYRSRHESLIAFSNSKYYENKLYTFPSPNDMVNQVHLIQVEGFYDRGKTKQNKAEAEAIVSEIMRRLSDESLRKQSIGVVTFSSVQQNLIADMLESEFSKHPDLDEIASNAEEPIFIKNLENVQGDERDVILFSVGYGPDEQGRVALNFGPLNRDGGWRRLNVAVSRARHEMLIFSVLKPEQIDLNRTRSDGLAGLKAFLEFAGQGKRALQNTGHKNPDAHGMVEIIADRIRSLGYEVHTSIGCSGYQVDIGVIHPNKPDSYMLGILCDSTNYHQGGNALDRNSIQESVLRSLGWRISRIWVLDWWENAEKELERVKAELDISARQNVLQTTTDIESEKPSVHADFAFEKIASEILTDTLKVYEPAVLQPVMEYQGNSEYFSHYESIKIIKPQLEAVLMAEAPVNREVLCKRVLEAWGISRMGARINRRFDDILAAMHMKDTRVGDTIFYWHNEMEPKQYDAFRVPSTDEKSRRNMEQIPPEEIAAAIKYILSQQIGLLKEDLERETARIFGFARCTEAMQKYIRTGIELAIEKKWASVEGERISASS